MSAADVCSQLDQVSILEVPARADVPGCEECLKIGGRWCVVDEVAFVLE
jgi:hypothetical protein